MDFWFDLSAIFVSGCPRHENAGYERSWFTSFNGFAELKGQLWPSDPWWRVVDRGCTSPCYPHMAVNDRSDCITIIPDSQIAFRLPGNFLMATSMNSLDLTDKRFPPGRCTCELAYFAAFQ